MDASQGAYFRKGLARGLRTPSNGRIDIHGAHGVPELDDQFGTRERLYRSILEPGLSKHVGHGTFTETKPDMRKPVAQLFAVVFGEIDDRDTSAGHENPGRFMQRLNRILGEVKNLVEQHSVEAFWRER